MKQRHLEVPRTARYAILGEGGPESREVWFVLHGYRQLARRFLRRFVDLADGSRVLVAPEALNRFYLGREEGRHGPGSRVGGTWMTREDREHEIRDYVRYLDRLAAEILRDVRGGEVHRTTLGFSQGLQTAARWVVLGDAPPPDRLVLWGDYLPPDLDMERAARRLAGVEVVLVVGEADPSRREDLARDQAERLERHGIRHRVITHPGGHELDPDVLAALADAGDSRTGGPREAGGG